MKKLISLFLGLCLMAGIMPVMAESAASHEITGCGLCKPRMGGKRADSGGRRPHFREDRA